MAPEYRSASRLACGSETSGRVGGRTKSAAAEMLARRNSSEAFVRALICCVSMLRRLAHQVAPKHVRMHLGFPTPLVAVASRESLKIPPSMFACSRGMGERTGAVPAGG